MLSRRYTIVVADRSNGVVRRLTISLVPTLVTVVGVLSLPILIGLGARWSASAEVSRLQAAKANLSLENASFRQATAALTSQITSLDEAIEQLSHRSTIDPASLRAMRQLPALVRTRASGGTSLSPAVSPLLAAAASSPENTFGILRELLGALQSRLLIVRTDVEHREAVAAATPSIWPAHGWLSANYGYRMDPISGGPDYHPALDISADRGQPVYVTADGKVSTAGSSGAYGNLIEVDHGFGMLTRYAHLSQFAVVPGAAVKRGDIIGYVGATGRTTGAHLHYEVWLHGKPVNPLRLLTGAD